MSGKEKDVLSFDALNKRGKRKSISAFFEEERRPMLQGES